MAARRTAQRLVFWTRRTGTTDRRATPHHTAGSDHFTSHHITLAHRFSCIQKAQHSASQRTGGRTRHTYVCRNRAVCHKRVDTSAGDGGRRTAPPHSSAHHTCAADTTAASYTPDHTALRPSALPPALNWAAPQHPTQRWWQRRQQKQPQKQRRRQRPGEAPASRLCAQRQQRKRPEGAEQMQH